MGGIVGLGGGIGAARLWEALAGPARGGRGPLTLVLNTANDVRLHGLRICPDIDTVLYALSGRLDAGRGWGLRDESFRCLAALAGLGGAPWFRLGDLDLATHLYRTGLLRDGASLTEVTRRLAESSGITARILPMSDDDVTTMVVGVDGRLLHYQEYLVRERAAPAVRGVRFEGIGQARPAPGVLAAIESATHIVLGPANPVAGLLPILGLPGVTETLRQHRDRVTAISPIVASTASTGPEEKLRSHSRAALLASIGLPATASGVARLYRDVCTRFVYDPADRDEAAPIAAYGLEPVPAPLPAAQDADPAPLLAAILGDSPSARVTG